MSTIKLPDPSEAHAFFANKMTFTTGPVELNSMFKHADNINVVDVRLAEDYAKGHIPGAVNLPKDKWDTFAELEKNTINVIYCYSHVCHLAANAAAKFAAQGYPVMEMDGGFKSWQEHELDIES